jgi:PAS domain S-box-containing protein
VSTEDDRGVAPQPGLAANEELVAALKMLPDPVFIFKAVRAPDGSVEELTYAFLNEAAARLYGRPAEAVLGHGQLELFPSVREVGIWDTYLAVIETGSPESFDVPWFEENGVEGSFRLTAVRFGDGLLISATDVTEQRRAEGRLAETSLRYQLLAENASDVVAFSRPDRTLEWVSPAVANELGWAPEDLIGTRLSDLIHPDDEAATAAERRAVYSGHEIENPEGGFVVRVRAKSGQYRWVSSRVVPLADESGEHVGVITSMLVVDDLVQAREEATANQTALRATLDSLLDPEVRYEAVRDDAGQLVDLEFVGANPAACAYFEMDYADLIGSRLLDFFPGLVEAGLFEKYRQVVETGEALILDDFDYVQELLNAERRYDIRAARVGDGLSATWRDVTDRHAADRRLAESEEQYRLVAENVSDVAMRLSSERRFEWVSDPVAHVMGWQPSDLVGHLIDEFVHHDDLAEHGQVIADTASGRALNVDFRFRRRDGTYRWVACRTRLSGGEDGTPTAVVGGLVDIQERKEAEARELNRLAELERFQRLTVGRELKMIELKKQIEYLRKHVAAEEDDVTTGPESEDPSSTGTEFDRH